MSCEHILWALVPLEADERHGCKVRLAGRDKGSVQRISLGARGRPRGNLAVLKPDATEGVVVWHNSWIVTAHNVPSLRHAQHAEIGLPHAFGDARADLQFAIELIHTAGGDRCERCAPKFSAARERLAQHQFEGTFVFVS